MGHPAGQMTGPAEARNELLHSAFRFELRPYNSRFVSYSEGIVGADLPEARRPTPDKSGYWTSAVPLPQMSG